MSVHEGFGGAARIAGEQLEMTTVASELSMRARNGIERLLGPKCKEWTPSQLAARLAELSGLDVMRTPNIGRFTHQEIEVFLERHGHRFADSWALDGYPRTIAARLTLQPGDILTCRRADELELQQPLFVRED